MERFTREIPCSSLWICFCHRRWFSWSQVMDRNGRDGFSHSQLTEEVCRMPFACKAVLKPCMAFFRFSLRSHAISPAQHTSMSATMRMAQLRKKVSGRMRITGSSHQSNTQLSFPGKNSWWNTTKARSKLAVSRAATTTNTPASPAAVTLLGEVCFSLYAPLLATIWQKPGLCFRHKPGFSISCPPQQNAAAVFFSLRMDGTSWPIFRADKHNYKGIPDFPHINVEAVRGAPDWQKTIVDMALAEMRSSRWLASQTRTPRTLTT